MGPRFPFPSTSPETCQPWLPGTASIANLLPSPQSLSTLNQILRQFSLLLALALLPAAGSAALQLRWHSESPLQPGEIRPATARLWNHQQVLWVDIRPQPRFDSGHIPGALSCPAQQWTTRSSQVLARWSAEQAVVVYGDAGEEAQAHQLSQRMRDQLGFETVYVLKGGWQAWRK